MQLNTSATAAHSLHLSLEDLKGFIHTVFADLWPWEHPGMCCISAGTWNWKQALFKLYKGAKMCEFWGFFLTQQQARIQT